MAGASEIERHPAAPSANVEDRVALALGQLPPQRQVGAIGATLQVVPDNRRGERRPQGDGIAAGRGGHRRGARVLRGAHDHALLASPRATSSSRSDSIAV